MSEYGDAIMPDGIERAAERALELRLAASGISLDVHVSNAVAQTICACVLQIEDDLEHHLSGTHAAIMDKVRRQVDLCLAAAVPEPTSNPVDVALDESFPASDPPGWIWERPSDC